MKELLVVGAVTLILFISIAITVPVELASRDHTQPTKLEVANGRSLRYFIVGDYGQYEKDAGLQPVQEVAAQLSNRSLHFPVDFIATTGDNIYPSGMKDVFDWRQFEMMYSVFDQPGIAGKPWFPVLGNHDCENRLPMLQAHDVYPMWRMSDAYYNFSVRLDNSTRATFVFLDGCTISCEEVESLPLPSYCKKYNYTSEEIKEQYAWLEEVLTDSKDAAWVLVHTHMPPFSVGSGSGDNEALKHHLYTILNEYGVDFLFTGHEHLMEYLFVPRNSSYESLPAESFACDNFTRYLGLGAQDSVIMQQGHGLQEVIIGSSGHPLDELCPNKTTNMDLFLFGSTTYGFVQVEVETDAVTVEFFSVSDAEPLYTVQVVR